jgi:hypothetical protein
MSEKHTEPKLEHAGQDKKRRTVATSGDHEES